MNEEFELISVPKELLENLVRRILAEYISLSTPEPEQDEPVDISDKSEPTIGAILPNGVRVTNVHDAYIAGMFEGSGMAKLKAEQDEEPVAWMNGMRNLLSWDKFYEDMTPLYLHPAPQKPFVRLSEEEMKNCWGEPDKLNTQALINFARAIEDALEEKNK